MAGTAVIKEIKEINGKWFVLNEDGSVDYEAKSHNDALAHCGIGVK